MAEHIHDTHSNGNGTSAATILVSVVIVLIIALAFYFGVIRGNLGGENSGNGVNVELNTSGAGESTGGTVNGGDAGDGGILDY